MTNINGLIAIQFAIRSKTCTYKTDRVLFLFNLNFNLVSIEISVIILFFHNASELFCPSLNGLWIRPFATFWLK